MFMRASLRVLRRTCGRCDVIDRDASNAYTCPGKVRYLERRWAKQAAKAIRRRFGDKQNVYRCTACGLWHLGHAPKGWVQTPQKTTNPEERS